MIIGKGNCVWCYLVSLRNGYPWLKLKGGKDFDPIFMINTIWSLARSIDVLDSDYDANHSDKLNS